MSYGYERRAEKLDAMVLGAIKSFSADRPATRIDLWSMCAVRKQCCTFGVWEPIGVLERSIQRLKKAGKIKYSRKPAGWVAT